MKAIFSLIIFISFCTIQIVAQTQVDYQPLKSAGEIPAEFRSITANKVKSAQAEEAKRNKRDFSSKRTVDEFLLRNNYAIDDLLNSGKVLFGDPVTQYINLVADKVLANDLKFRSELRFYALKSNEVNAFATNAGIIFVTIGLIAQIENEAQLAFVLAHEIAHIEKYHSIESVLQAKNVLDNSRRNYANYDERIKVLSSFSRDKELEADSIGFYRYCSAGYDKSASAAMMDVLQFSFTPFVNIEFKPDFFELDSMKFPSICSLDSVPKIPLNSADEDDTKSTHPNLNKRRELLRRLSQRVDQNGSYFQIGSSDFESVRKMARNEMVHLDLIERNYIDVIYNSWALNELSGMNDKYYEESIAKALYGISKYCNKERDDYVFYEEGMVYENLAVCNKLLRELRKEQINLIALRFLFMIEEKYHSQFIKLILDDLILDGMKENELSLKQIMDGVSEARLFLDSHTEAVSTENPQDSTSVSSEDVYVSENGSKYERLRENLEKYQDETDSTSKWHMLFHYMAYSNVNFDNLAPRFDSLKLKLDQNKAATKAWNEDLHYNETKYKRHGYSLGIDKVVFVDPAYYELDKRNGVKLVDSERSLFEFTQQIKDCATAANLECDLLYCKSMLEGEISKYNDLAILNDWMAERMMHEKQDLEIIPLQTEFTRPVAESLGTDFVCYTGVFTSTSMREYIGRKILATILLAWPLLPIVIIHSCIPKRITFYYCMLYNIKTGQVKWIHDRTIHRSGKKGYINSLMFDSIYQIKKSDEK